MDEMTRQELMWKFGKKDDPEVEARRLRVLQVMLDSSPETKTPLRQEGLDVGIKQGKLASTRTHLRRVFLQRGLTPTQYDDARIEACTDLATLERWFERAFTAPSVAAALD